MSLLKKKKKKQDEGQYHRVNSPWRYPITSFTTGWDVLLNNGVSRLITYSLLLL